ncbi:unnamed protein product [Adineta ricciae]|uniref:Uncharacterized protein n=1 Tax=Adineta ricciae TaxID=249248 RepID=A0A814PWZ0_ADIRI|nr:unnamed protein product [Adineta ricciae]CAF1111468.1 unnamed protein product [Adineta ricciae]
MTDEIDVVTTNQDFTQVEQSGTETAGSGDRIYLVWPGTHRNMSKTVAGNGYRISPSNSWDFLGGFRSETASFLKDFVESSWNPASGTIVLGMS